MTMVFVFSFWIKRFLTWLKVYQPKYSQCAVVWCGGVSYTNITTDEGRESWTALDWVKMNGFLSIYRNYFLRSWWAEQKMIKVYVSCEMEVLDVRCDLNEIWLLQWTTVRAGPARQLSPWQGRLVQPLPGCLRQGQGRCPLPPVLRNMKYLTSLKRDQGEIPYRISGRLNTFE